LARGKRIVVRGAASGIGLGAARVFRELGAEIVVADRDEKALDAAWPDLEVGRRHTVDVVDETACEAMFAEANAAMDGIDGVFHAAGVSDVVAPAAELDVADWQRIVDVNLRGTFLICRAAGRIMLKQGQGSVVTISSVNGITGIPRRHAYGPPKPPLRN
jgi:NAD(P)-dependent dehydrogenase (short-subunit alcohol dehydrogenase family)